MRVYVWFYKAILDKGDLVKKSGYICSNSSDGRAIMVRLYEYLGEDWEVYLLQLNNNIETTLNL